MVIQDKKIGEIHTCVDLRYLNDACVHHLFLDTFIDEVLGNVGVKEMYLFTDGFLGYH